MSLGFELELNGVKVSTQSGASFGDTYKGVTLFKTQLRPGVNAVIETGTLGATIGGTSTLELVSGVDINPYVPSPTWRVQVDQLVALTAALAQCTRAESIDSFVKGTQTTPVEFSARRTSKDIQLRMGAQEVSFLRSLWCCWPPEDTRVTEVRSATLVCGGTPFTGDCIQVNFSTNLDHLGACLLNNQHPFEELLDDMHLQHERAVVKAIYQLGLTLNLRHHRRLLGYLYLVLHRLTFEGSKVVGKNRFLFLPRFNLLTLREKRLNSEDRRRLGELDLEGFAKLRPEKGHLRLTDVFSVAYQNSLRIGSSPVKNTVEEFLRAALHGDLGGLDPQVVTKNIMRVPDSTPPKWVKGADNIIFEGRLAKWTPFAGKDTDLEDMTPHEKLKALKRGLTRLGEIVTAYDNEPQPDEDEVVLNIPNASENEGDGMLIPLKERF
ncbi:hypothetical protein JYK02_38355 [Corallococcus macrosporus]|uniref:Uncharacterized protein n=1 Tax=Corallococcus macrosporus TaxID=35 RepID=A0ABS3DPY9_9BACT|nr:hypothetical protein [Corallococcus macrosporus]MBN8233397.1 hypothetical protein [Corallococcus macrosporus]